VPLDETAKCTVCIPTYNQSRYLRRAIQSVVEQTAPVRLIVSNDASPDDTAVVIAELQREYAFTAVNHEQNRGISAHLEWLLRQPETPLIMRLDSDDFLHPEYISELQGLMERYPKAGHAHCAIMEVDAEDRPIAERRLARTQEYQDPERVLRRSVMGYQVAANVIMFRRDALISVNFGAGSEKLNFVEDYDLSIRLADAGWGNVYSNKILASYRMWGGSSRPVARRKMTELRGLTQIFTGSLHTAFERRRWSMGTLKRRRMQLALNNSDVLDRSSFEPGEREQMVQALVDLGGTKAVLMFAGEGVVPRSVRRSFAGATEAQIELKRWIKRVLLRRR
jgi:cellulose synthase/poly-beta-1,6-N-acetylglucosamine synthase-like glycosyltransferase